MNLVNTLVNAGVVAAAGIALAWFGKGRFDALEQRMDRLEERLDRRIDRLQTSSDSIRSDLTQVALAVGVRQRTGNA